MPLRYLFSVCLLIQASSAGAVTYSIQNPSGSFGSIWFPAITSANLSNGGVGGIAGFIETDGTLGPLSAQNIVGFQLGVNALIPPNSWSADVSAPLPGTGDVYIDGTAFSATATGLFFDFDSTSASYVKFERDSTGLGQADIFFCLNAGGANCGGATPFDLTAAVLFPSRPEWSSFVGKSLDDLLNVSNRADILSENNVMLLAERVSVVPGPIAGAGLPGLFIAIAGFIGWRCSRRAITGMISLAEPKPVALSGNAG